MEFIVKILMGITVGLILGQKELEQIRQDIKAMKEEE